MEQEAKPSAAAELSDPFEIVELPVAQGPGGTPFFMKLVCPTIEGVVEILKGIAPAGTDEELEAEEQPEDEPTAGSKTAAALANLEVQMKQLLEMGAATEPRVVFDHEGVTPDAIPWRRLHIRNRSFLVGRFVRLAGLGPTKVDRIASFREGPSGGAVRAAGDAGMPAPPVAAPGAPGDAGAHADGGVPATGGVPGGGG